MSTSKFGVGKNAWNSTIEGLETGKISGTYWPTSLIKNYQALVQWKTVSREPDRGLEQDIRTGITCIHTQRWVYTTHTHTWINFILSVCASLSLSVCLCFSLPPRFYEWMWKPEVSVRCFLHHSVALKSYLLRSGAYWLSRLADQQVPWLLPPPQHDNYRCPAIFNLFTRVLGLTLGPHACSGST